MIEKQFFTLPFDNLQNTYPMKFIFTELFMHVIIKVFLGRLCFSFVDFSSRNMLEIAAIFK